MLYKKNSKKSEKTSSQSWKGTIVVEASYLMPLTLVLYGILILIAASLLVRCLSSQNRFLLEHQETRYTDGSKMEVIFSDR